MLNVALTLGFLISLLNLGDFMLRPNQKESFQKAIETVVLWLDYQRPLQWVSSIRYVRTRHLGCITIGLMAASMVLMLSLENVWAFRLGLLLLVDSYLLLGSIPFWKWASQVLDVIGPDHGPGRFALYSLAVFTGVFSFQY